MNDRILTLKLPANLHALLVEVAEARYDGSVDRAAEVALGRFCAVMLPHKEGDLADIDYSQSEPAIPAEELVEVRSLPGVSV